MIAGRDIELFFQFFLNRATMPKESRCRRTSIDRPSPLPSRSDRRRHRPSPSRNNSTGSPRPAANNSKEWDEIRCPVCMDHPHNAVLLHCSSHKMGCRPFMCNTSCRHSNCLDQYRKAFRAPKLTCPLCRGSISGWKVVEAARKGMNAKARNCSAESCYFTGDYSDLRMHARKNHPLVRPSDAADSERRLEWGGMEEEPELEDLYSTLQPALAEEDEEIEDFGSWLPRLMSTDLI